MLPLYSYADLIINSFVLSDRQMRCVCKHFMNNIFKNPLIRKFQQQNNKNVYCNIVHEINVGKS